MMKRLYLMVLCLCLISTPVLAAKQTIGAADTGAQTRTKLNSNFTELYNADDLKADIADAVQQWDGGYATGYTFNVDDIVAYQGKLWKCLSSHAKASGKYPGNSGNEWAEVSGTGGGGSGSTNLSATAGANSVVVASDTGNDATLNSASTIAAGVMTAADKSKLDGISANATANSADATLLNRSNHTGTQVSSTISDFASTVNTVLATPLSKLSGIATGAEVNVQADWNQATNTADDYIKNKPTVVATDVDFTVTAEATFDDIILPKFDTMEMNVQSPEPACASGEYKIYFFGTKARQCINGTASDIGSGTAGASEIADLTDWPSGLTATELGYVNGVTSNIQTQINNISAGAWNIVTEDPVDPAVGAPWINTTDNKLKIATVSGQIEWEGVYSASDFTPSAFSFTDQVAVSTSATNPIVSAAVDIDGLGARATTVSVSGDTGCGWQKSTDTGNTTWSSCTSSTGTVNNDEDTQIKACVNRSSSPNTSTSCTVTVGTVSDAFSVRTLGLTGATIGTNGTTLTLTGSDSLSVGSGGNGGFDVDCSTGGSGITATYSSGAPGTSLVYTLGKTVVSGETCDLDFTQPGNGIEATTGGADLASITSAAITNNSTQSGITYIINDQFDSGNCSGWALGNGMTCSTSTGDAVLTESSYSIIEKENVLSVSTTYNYSITTTAETMTAGSMIIETGGTNVTVFQHNTSVGTFTGTFTTGASRDDFQLQFLNVQSGGTVTISDIKVWQ